MANSNEVRTTIQGQAQAEKEAVAQPFDGQVEVRETRVALDEVILDANGPKAVQIPEEVGTVQDRLALPIERLLKPTAQEQFDSGDAKEATGSKDGVAVNAAGEDVNKKASEPVAEDKPVEKPKASKKS